MQDITAVQTALQAADQQSLPSAATSREEPGSSSAPTDLATATISVSPALQTASPVLSEELLGLLESIEAIRTAFVGRERPAGLPLPGQPLPVQAPMVLPRCCCLNGPHHNLNLALAFPSVLFRGHH